MVNSYDDMMGDPIEPGNHPATNMPQATQHYAGDVVHMGPYFSAATTANTQQRINDKSESRPVGPSAPRFNNVVPIR